MIKLFASDLDGTLLNALHEVDETIRAAVREAVAAGAHVVPATGRLMPPYGKHGFCGMKIDSICANGSIIRGRNGGLLKTFELDPAFIEELLVAFPQICFDCATPEGLFSSGSFEEHQAAFRRDNPIRRVVMRGMRARGRVHEAHFFDQSVAEILSHEVCKITCRTTSAALDKELAAFLADHDDRVVNAPFDPALFEITDIACNKGASVAWLARYYGIEEDEVAVYGDGGNDLDMLRRFKHSYAVSNASDEAKAAASATIGSCLFHAVPRHIVRTLRSERSRVRIS